MGRWSITGLPHSIKFTGTHLYTWVERDTVRVKCLAQEHNTMSPARALTRTTRSRDERTNHVRRNTSVGTACRTNSKTPGYNVSTHGHKSTEEFKAANVDLVFQFSSHTIVALRATPGGSSCLVSMVLIVAEKQRILRKRRNL